MEHSELTKDIFMALKAPDYDINIMMYDKNGELTIDTDVVSWFYIEPYDCMIRIPVGEQSIIRFWKSKNNIYKKEIIDLIMRLKKICNIKGYIFNVKIFNKTKMINKVKGVEDTDIIEESSSLINESLTQYINWINNI